MKKRILSAVLLSLMLCLTAGCSGGGTPPVLTLNGTDLTLGESSPGTLTTTGYEITYLSQMPIGKIPKNSWISESLTARKDGETYAYFYIYNPSSDAKLLLSAPLYKVTFKMNSEENSSWAKTNILVNGINFYGMDSVAVKEAMKDFKLKQLDSGALRYDDGDYRYIIRFDDAGLVEEVQVDLEIPKSYTSTT